MIYNWKKLVDNQYDPNSMNARITSAIGNPVLVKSLTCNSAFALLLLSAATEALLALGKELTGRPMAPLVIRAALMTKSFGWPNKAPIRASTGMVISAHTVEDKKFATTAITVSNTEKTSQDQALLGSIVFIDSVMSDKSPDLSTASPSTMPPPMSVSTGQGRFCQSLVVRKPSACSNIIPASPKIPIC